MALAEMDPIGGIVRFASGQTGSIYLTCPVSAFFDANGEDLPNYLWANLEDDDGTAVNCGVNVNLIKESRAFDSWAILSSIYNGAGAGQYANSTNRQYWAVSFSHTWNTTTNVYWVELQLYRNGSCSGNISVQAVGLYESP
jgi:hypothetical protein